MRGTGNVVDIGARIRSRISVEDRGHKTACWISDRACQPNGYTKIGIDNRTYLTHRVAYETFIGPIPDALVLDHLCRQRACCNPEHLEPVTTRENLLRGDTLPAAETAMTHCQANHEFTPGNTRVTSRGKRACRACDAIRARKYRATTGR